MQATHELLENLHEQLATRTDATQSGTCFRLREEESRLMVSIEAPEVEDTTFQHSGRTVLAVEPGAVSHCGNRTLLLDGDKWVLR